MAHRSGPLSVAPLRPPARLAIAALASLALGCTGVAALPSSGATAGASIAANAPRFSGTTITSTAPPVSTTLPAVPVAPADGRWTSDGSLGDQPTRRACTLLTQAEIAGQFHAPVGPGRPTYPYCQWLVGQGSFLALAVEPHTTFAEATRFVEPLDTVRGLGEAAMIADNRYLYFEEGSTAYWLLWESPGDFTGLETAQLVALARDVLATDPPAGSIPAPAPAPAGPPVYFAGDSTAAGPEWAWTAYHEDGASRTLAEYQVGSGLVMSGYFDWPQHLLAVAAERHPKLVIWMGSANDGQSVFLDGTFQAVGSPAWDAAYAKTVGATMQALTGEGCKVLWIGEPSMEDPTLSADMAVIDSIFARQASLHPGVTYYDPGTVLDGPHGSYAGSIEFHGQLVPVRLDGVHLNETGSIVLADAVAPIVYRLLGAAPPTTTTTTPAG